MADNQGLFIISAEQREELQSWAHSRSLPAGYVFRARLILALAQGLTYREIELSLGASAPTVSKWKGRFEQLGMEGLQGQHKGSKPRSATPAVQSRVIRRAQQKPNDGSTHWSVRKLAEELGVSKSTVHRILAQAKLQPHRLERYMASNDPQFEEKAADIIGLYLELLAEGLYRLATLFVTSDQFRPELSSLRLPFSFGHATTMHRNPLRGQWCSPDAYDRNGWKWVTHLASGCPTQAGGQPPGKGCSNTSA